MVWQHAKRIVIEQFHASLLKREYERGPSADAARDRYTLALDTDQERK